MEEAFLSQIEENSFGASKMEKKHPLEDEERNKKMLDLVIAMTLYEYLAVKYVGISDANGFTVRMIKKNLDVNILTTQITVTMDMFIPYLEKLTIKEEQLFDRFPGNENIRLKEAKAFVENYKLYGLTEKFFTPIKELLFKVHPFLFSFYSKC